MKCIASLLLLLITALGICQDNKSLLWKISGNGLKKPSYIFGTIHAIPSNKIFIPQNLISSFMSSDALILETGLTPNMPDSLIKKEIMMPVGMTLKDLYMQRDYSFLERYFIDTLKGQVKKLISFKPIWLLSVISSRWYPNYVAYESIFINKAKENLKPVLGLEKTSDQMQLFDKISLQEQSLILINTLRNREREQQNYNKLLKLYLAQDINAISNETYSQSKQYSRYYDVFFDQRNNLWAGKIADLINNKSCFIAVGAGHLGGSNGLIIKLRKLGYRVETL